MTSHIIDNSSLIYRSYMTNYSGSVITETMY